MQLQKVLMPQGKTEGLLNVRSPLALFSLLPLIHIRHSFFLNMSYIFISALL